MAKNSMDVPRPFLKWAGGKRQLLPQIVKYVPDRYETYIEPFAGGGAMFFYLKPARAILIDNNHELMNVYDVIKNNVDDLIASLKKHVYAEAYYYKMRDVDRVPSEFAKWSSIERASRTICLNRICFNGLYRVNKKGEFNVPFGRYVNPLICDEDNLRAVHDALQNVELITDSFERCLGFARENDFIYLDPPYVPLSSTSNFTSYTSECFDNQYQEKLKDVFLALDDKKCKLMLSNSYCDFILELYKGFKLVTIMANRAINSKIEKRGKIKEILIMNDYV
ncbi:MAG TPA: DNA adenine methylase [Candidatus Lokiarchaeia archaeon]|nr:DNA adenine methylase [Candidatus Lokiarchaeia archaeon]